MAVLAVIALVLIAAIVGVVQALSDQYPDGRTSPRDRLLRNNPALAARNVRWTTAARRVRIGRLTALVISVALYVAFQRPTTTSATSATSVR
jgi:hypothetical protein